MTFDCGNGKSTSQLQCSTCLGYPVHVKHKTGQLPLYDSERVLLARDEPEHGRKEVQFCTNCQKENWGRAVKMHEDDKTKIIHFTCFICTNKSEIILKKHT